MTNPADVAANLDENSCALFVEIISNPQMEVADLKKLSSVAHENNVPLIADTTIIPFTNFKAKDFGIDIDVISSTKYISGGGTSLGGLIIDYGKFNWKNSAKLNYLSEIHESAFNFKLRKEIHRNIGAYMTPEVAYIQSLGLETLSVRFDRHSTTCLELAKNSKRYPQSNLLIIPDWEIMYIMK